MLGLLLANTDPTEAIKHLIIACDLDSSNQEFRLVLGNLLSKENPNAAIRYYDEALVFDPENVEVLYKLVSLLVSVGKLDKAIDTMERILLLRPSSDQARDYLQKLRQAARSPN